MRIGLVSYEYPPQTGLGGVGTYTFRLAGALGRAGHEVVVLAGPGQQPQPQPNVTVHRLPAQWDPPLSSRIARWLYWKVLARTLSRLNPVVWHWLRWDLASGAALEEIHRATPLDVVEAPEHAANGLMVGRMGLWPMVLRTHGPWDLFYELNRTAGGPMNHLLARLERHSACYAQTITSPSYTMADYIRKHWELTQPPRVVPNFMDVPHDRPPLTHNSVPRILCAGRIEGFKGQDVLVRAFGLVARKHRTARLILIGPDQWSQRQPFAQFVDHALPDRRIRRRVELRGPQSLSDTQAELRQADVVVVPSTGFESFSFSTLEAMAAGRAIIVAASGAMPELVEWGRCGLMVHPGDPAELAMALDKLLCEPDLREHLAIAAHDRARCCYSTPVVTPAILRVYRQTQEQWREKSEIRSPISESNPKAQVRIEAQGAREPS